MQFIEGTVLFISVADPDTGLLGRILIVAIKNGPSTTLGVYTVKAKNFVGIPFV
jgi:hypothetical protein